MRDISREEWVGLYRKYLQYRGSVDAGECPRSDEIASFFERRTSRRKKYRVLRHILDCPACQEEFEWMHELEIRIAGLREEVERLGRKSPIQNGLPTPASPSRSFLRRWAWAGTGAAAVLIVLLLIVPMRRFPRDHRLTYRGTPQFQFHEVYPPLGSVVRRADLHFGWKAPLPGGSFVLELFGPAMELVWRSPASKEMETRVPDPVLRFMKEDHVYFWSISGTADDQSIIESPLYSFRLAR